MKTLEQIKKEVSREWKYGACPKSFLGYKTFLRRYRYDLFKRYYPLDIVDVKQRMVLSHEATESRGHGQSSRVGVARCQRSSQGIQGACDSKQ